ncbi:hypothetical protein BDZ45DRAFT_726423 [Acephala macrosclerotiorum]|nr:hypothetical protein BDZ45DRAFT_726423 [Acephala macrosclerotiorum]
MPTPSLQYLGNRLQARQAGAANPTICGWIDGNGADPVTCGPQFICGTTQSSIVGCCKTTTGPALCADIVTTCYDYLGASCDVTCQANLNNLICTSPSPYCVEYLYPRNSFGYGCGPYAEYTKTVALTVSANGGAGSLTGVGTFTSLSSSSSSLSSSSSPVSSSQAPSSSTPPSPSSTLGAGSIAGIAVGSVASAGILLITIWFVWRKRRQISQVSNAAGIHNPVRDSEATYVSKSSAKTFGSSPPWLSPQGLDQPMQDRPYTGPTIQEMDGGERQ